MEWKDLLDSGLAVAAFAAFLRVVFVDIAEMKARLAQLEGGQREQAHLLQRLVNATEALAYRQGVRLRKEKEA